MARKRKQTMFPELPTTQCHRRLRNGKFCKLMSLPGGLHCRKHTGDHQYVAGQGIAALRRQLPKLLAHQDDVLFRYLYQRALSTIAALDDFGAGKVPRKPGHQDDE